MKLNKISLLEKLALANVLVYMIYIIIDILIINKKIYWIDSLFTITFFVISIFLYKVKLNEEGRNKFFNKSLAKALIIVYGCGAVFYLIFMYSRLQ